MKEDPPWFCVISYCSSKSHCGRTVYKEAKKVWFDSLDIRESTIEDIFLIIQFNLFLFKVFRLMVLNPSTN